MQLHKNNIIIASAGCRKTTHIIEDALSNEDRKILITTYTIDNTAQIESYIISRVGYVPKNITIMPWFTFLLREGVRPYQNYILPNSRVESIDFTTRTAPYYIGNGRSNLSWYLNKGGYLYRDRVSEFVFRCNLLSKGLVVERLESRYDNIYIDEMQDLVGWDQEFIGLLMNSKIFVTIVGDPRQATYRSNNSRKNSGMRGSNMMQWVEKLSKNTSVAILALNECYRSNQDICDFADELYPKLSKATSENSEVTGHDGIFIISVKELREYVAMHKPTILRWDKRTNTLGYKGMNIGVSKGQTFDRVLIFPTMPIKKYLETRNVDDAGDLSKLYVAVTRARFSVAFVI